MPMSVDDSGAIHIEKDQPIPEEGHKLLAKTVVCQPCANLSQSQIDPTDK